MATETRIIVHGAEVISEETDVETRIVEAGAQVISEETDLAARVLVAGAQVVSERMDFAARVLQFGAQVIYHPWTVTASAIVGPLAIGAAVVAVALSAPSLVGPQAIGTPTFGQQILATSIVNGSQALGSHYVVDANTLVAPSLVGERAIGDVTINAQINIPSIVRTPAIGEALVIDDRTIVAVPLLGPRALGVASIGQVAVPRTLRFRTAAVEYGPPGIIIVRAVAEDPGLYAGYVALGGSPLPNSSPTVLGVPGSTRLIVFDSVLLRDQDDGIGYYLAVSGFNPAWTGATISRSINDGQSYSDIATLEVQSVIGYAKTALGTPASVATWDTVNTLDVILIRPDIYTLISESEENVLAGANAAALIKLNGDVEIIQWQTSTALGSGIYRLSNLLRGRRGSEFAVADHAIGEPFIVLNADALRRINASSSEIGQPQIFKATTLGTLITDAPEVHFTL